MTYTNFDDEVDAHTNTATWPYYLIATVCAIAFAFMIADMIFGAEQVTYWLAELYAKTRL